MYDVRGRRAIVTGAAQGLGKEFTRRLLGLGCSVCMADVDTEKGEAAKEELETLFEGRQHVKVHFVKCDVTKDEDWTNLWNEAECVLGGSIGVLCNNAGLNPNHGWRLCLDVMLVGACRGLFLAMERMGAANGGSGGRIINTCSCASFVTAGLGGLENTGYGMSKHGLANLTRTFAEIVPDIYSVEGVKCYGIAPWFADTNLVRTGFGDKRVRTALGDFTSINDIKKNYKVRVLTVEEVGDSFVKALEHDKTGAIYVVFPDCPLIEFPTVQHDVWFRAVLLLSAVVAKRLGVDLVTPRIILAIVLGMIAVVFVIMLWLF